jgi:WXG100 family type VII secretion target
VAAAVTDQTSVDVQGMVLAQQDFQGALDVVNTVYSSMTEERDTLAASWSGEAASAFGQALQNWLDDVYYVQQELIIMIETLEEHTGIYAKTNEGSQEMAQEFKSGLAGLDNSRVPATPRMFKALRETNAPRVLGDRMEAVRDTIPAQPMMMARIRATTPAERGVPAQYREAEQGTPLIPEERRMAVEAPLLPTESFRPLQPAMYAEERPSIPAEAPIPAEPALPLQPEEAYAETIPAIPALRADPELPLQPEEGYRVLGLQDTPLQPTLSYDRYTETPELPETTPGQG